MNNYTIIDCIHINGETYELREHNKFGDMVPCIVTKDNHIVDYTFDCLVDWLKDQEIN